MVASQQSSQLFPNKSEYHNNFLRAGGDWYGPCKPSWASPDHRQEEGREDIFQGRDGDQVHGGHLHDRVARHKTCLCGEQRPPAVSSLQGNDIPNMLYV